MAPLQGTPTVPDPSLFKITHLVGTNYAVWDFCASPEEIKMLRSRNLRGSDHLVEANYALLDFLQRRSMCLHTEI